MDCASEWSAWGWLPRKQAFFRNGDAAQRKARLLQPFEGRTNCSNNLSVFPSYDDTGVFNGMQTTCSSSAKQRHVLGGQLDLQVIDAEGVMAY